MLNSCDLDAVELQFELVDFTWPAEYRSLWWHRLTVSLTKLHFPMHVIWLKFRDNRIAHIFPASEE